MKNSAIIFALSVGLIIIYINSRATSAPLANISTYEYCRVSVRADGELLGYDAKGTSEESSGALSQLPAGVLYQQITGHPMPDPKKTSIDIELINEMATQGWEVVQCDHQFGTSVYISAQACQVALFISSF